MGSEGCCYDSFCSICHRTHGQIGNLIAAVHDHSRNPKKWRQCHTEYQYDRTYAIPVRTEEVKNAPETPLLVKKDSATYRYNLVSIGDNNIGTVIDPTVAEQSNISVETPKNGGSAIPSISMIVHMITKCTINFKNLDIGISFALVYIH